MTTTELKQRIADYLDTMDRKPFTVSPLRNLLRDCLNHIEELEEKIHKLESAKVWTRLDQLQSQLRERDADCAAMREAFCDETPYPLQSVILILRDAARHLLHSHDCDCLGHEKIQLAIQAVDPIVVRLDKALSTTAGRELLERLKAVEKERDEWRKTAGERLDLLTKAEGRALELLERLQKAEKLRVAAIEFINDWRKGDFELCKLAACDAEAIAEALQPKEAK